MTKTARWVVVCLVVFLSVFLLQIQLVAQVATATLSGTVTDAAGKAVPNAKVVVKNVASGKTADAVTSTTGTYEIENLPPGEYDVSVSASGFTAKSQRAMLNAETNPPVTIALAASSGLSVESLGFPTAQTQGSAQEQARLDKRSHMLKMHQRLGLITTVPMVAALFTGNMAGGRSRDNTGRNVHVALGSATAGLYFTTASFAIFAPKVPGTPTRGPIRLHKALAWIHGPGMVLTPILGAMAYEQKNRGERVHGIASAHVPVAVITSAAYGAAILSVSVRIRRHHD